MTNAEYTQKLAYNIQTIIDSYNFDMTCKDRDDIDAGEAIGIRRTLRLLGFKVKYNEDKTIESVALPEYVDADFFDIQ